MNLIYTKVFKGKLTTTDASAHVAVAVPIPENTFAVVKSKTLVMQLNNANRGAYEYVGGYYRVNTGNVTQLGATVTRLDIESAGGLAVSHVANTTNQTVDIEVTGVGTDRFYWEVEVEVIFQSTPYSID